MSATRRIVAERLRGLMDRSTNCRTQLELSRVAGVAQSTITRVLKGQVSITVDTACSLAQAFEITPAQLVSISEAEFEMAGVLSQLPEQGLLSALIYCRFVLAHLSSAK